MSTFFSAYLKNDACCYGLLGLSLLSRKQSETSSKRMQMKQKHIAISMLICGGMPNKRNRPVHDRAEIGIFMLQFSALPTLAQFADLVSRPAHTEITRRLHHIWKPQQFEGGKQNIGLLINES